MLDLCDEVLGHRGSRQHRFDWLRGDPGKSGRRARLPVDSYWPDCGVVVEYRELQHDRPMPHFDKPHVLTISGVHRGVQRALYDVRRDQEMPRHGIKLVILKPSDLVSGSRGRLLRQRDADMSVIRGMLRAREPRDETAD